MQVLVNIPNTLQLDIYVTAVLNFRASLSSWRMMQLFYPEVWGLLLMLVLNEFLRQIIIVFQYPAAAQ